VSRTIFVFLVHGFFETTFGSGHKNEDSVKSHRKEAPDQKRRTKVVPVPEAVGLSLSLASGASVAAMGRVNPEIVPVTSAPVARQLMAP
jgi:hypothetical protein